LLVTPRGGYKLRLTPKCLGIRVDHRSVIHRLHQSLPVARQVFRCFHGAAECDVSLTASTLCPSKGTVALGPRHTGMIGLFWRAR
jgi:hypothetical protein